MQCKQFDAAKIDLRREDKSMYESVERITRCTAAGKNLSRLPAAISRKKSSPLSPDSAVNGYGNTGAVE